ncbi:hypothetical protein [Scytonema millei]|uniref:Uncharacterized protein n=1 Tax=Scytonema millei VB511283 TaxID=1245923 RepID=A0A9X5E8A7_9CYAN|nr:hypothetical protein [Scytonema millei]NHC36999.1 hypothetical protein [Scytonema millei VB511283]
MSSFKDFMDKAQESPNQNLPASTTTLASIQYSLTAASCIISSPFLSINEEQKLSQKVSNLVHDKAFLSELSDQIGKPQVNESEDNFVKCSSDVLKKMLYKHFCIKG